MLKKKIIVACAGAVATSTIAAAKIEQLCKKHGIDVEICQIRISEIESNEPKNSESVLSPLFSGTGIVWMKSFAAT